MPDYADHLIAEKYKTLTPVQRALVDKFLTYIETQSKYPQQNWRELNADSFHYVGRGRRRNDIRVNLLLAISSTAIMAVTSITAQVQPVHWLLALSWMFYSIGLVIYRRRRLPVSAR